MSTEPASQSRVIVDEEDSIGGDSAAPGRQGSAELEGVVNYDEAPVVELDVDGISYRVDVGNGSAVAISERAAGSWAWRVVTEARFDGSRLQAKGLSYAIREALGQALVLAWRNQREE